MGKPKNIKISQLKEEIQNHLNEYHSLRKASRDFCIPRRTLGRYFNTQWNSKKDTQCIYEKNRTTFDTIDTPNKAYVLGVLIADGSINNKGTIRIEVKDRQLCEHVKNVFNSEAPIKSIVRTRKQFKVQSQHSFTLSITSLDFIESAKQWGFIPNKTHSNLLTIPNIPNNLKPHFVRGYFDGDGSIFNTKYGKMVGFTGNKTMMYSIKEYLNNLGIANIPNVKQDGSTNSWKFYFGAKKDVKAFYNLVYKNADMYLNRKKYKFEL